MVVEESIYIAAPPETVFAIYRDVGRWSTWDPDTRASSLDGPFALGTKGRLVPTKGREVPMEIIELTADRSFTVACQVPMFCMHFIHELVPAVGGTKVVQRLRTSGALGILLNPVIGRQVRHGFPRTLASLKRLAEARSSSSKHDG